MTKCMLKLAALFALSGVIGTAVSDPANAALAPRTILAEEFGWIS